MGSGVAASVLSSPTRDQTLIPCIARQIFNHWTTREVPTVDFQSSNYVSKQLLCVDAKLLQLCLTLCNPVDCSPPVSSVHGILQARILKWVATPSSKGSSQPRDQTCISYVFCIGMWALYPHSPLVSGAQAWVRDSAGIGPHAQNQPSPPHNTGLLPWTLSAVLSLSSIILKLCVCVCLCVYVCACIRSHAPTSPTHLGGLEKAHKSLFGIKAKVLDAANVAVVSCLRSKWKIYFSSRLVKIKMHFFFPSPNFCTPWLLFRHFGICGPQMSQIYLMLDDKLAQNLVA